MSFVQSIKRIAKGESNYDFVGKRKLWFTFSAAIVLVSILILFIRPLNLGLAFEGGSSFTTPIAEGSNPSITQIEEAVGAAGLVSPTVQIETAGEQRHIRVEAENVDTALRGDVIDAVAKIAGQTDTDQVSVQNVGPTWGEQVSRKALRALIVFLILVMIYIAVRFETKVAAATIVSLFHDLFITIGLYALIGFEVTPATVVAYLTILGYSLYDSVVVFDKVRENQILLTSTSRMTYSDMVNRSVNQTAMRSINTSLSSLLPVGGLLFVGVYLFGAETLKDLALALFLGIGVGSYSSIFLGPALLAVMKEREPKNRQLAARARPTALTPAVAGAGGATIGFGSGDSAGTSATSDSSSDPVSSTPPKGRHPVTVSRPGEPRGRRKRGGKRKR